MSTYGNQAAGEQAAQEHLDTLQEILDAGEDPRKVQHAVLRVQLDGSPAQRRKLQQIEERAAVKHDRKAGQGKPRKQSLVERANGIGDWAGLNS
jgi:hypothetical protein